MNTALPLATIDTSRPVALFDLQRQRVRLEAEIHERVHAVLAHGQFVLGPEVDELERRLAEFCGVPHAIGVSSGRDALMIGLMALGVGPGDAVFVPAFTFAATAGSVASVGAMPVFVDVDPRSFNMDAADLARAIDEVKAAGTHRPRVVMPVDLYGLPADYEAIAKVAEPHGLTVFADAAQSFGGATGGKRVGALTTISATSFYPTKPLGCYGDGGAILTDNDDVAEAVRRIRSHGRQGTGDAAIQLGVTGRLDTIQAAVLLVKLRVFEDELARRREIAARYDSELPSSLVKPLIPRGYGSAFALYTVQLENRDAVRDALQAKGIGTGLFYRLALHQHPAFADVPKRPLPVSERLADEVLSLPIHPDLTDGEIERVVAALKAEI